MEQYTDKEVQKQIQVFWSLCEADKEERLDLLDIKYIFCEIL